MRSYIALLLFLLVSGCGGPPTNFYTLTPIAASAAPVGARCKAAPVEVHRVLLPETLDRQSMVRMDGPGHLTISDQDRWAAPLDAMVQRILAEDLRIRLPSGRVILPGDMPPSGGAAGLDINIQRFSSDTAGHVTLQVDWTLLSRQREALQTHSELINTSAASGAAGRVAVAMSQAVGDLADRIAAILNGCPRGS